MSKEFCQHIDLAVKLCKLSGYSIEEVSTAWTGVKRVFYMSKPLTVEMKQRLEKEIPILKYWEATKDCHYAPDEGFVCNECKESISFPVKKYSL